MKKWTNKTKKTVALCLVAVAVIGGGSAYAYSSGQSKQKLEAAQTEVKKQEATLKTLNRDLKGYFDKKSPSYLVENMQESKIKELKKEVENATSLKETTLKVDHTSFDKEVEAVNKTMTKLETTFEKQQAVNKLFQEKAVNGAEISKELPIADDLKQETIDQVKKSVEKPTSDFEKTIQSLTAEAENQLKQLDKAKQATTKVYKDKVISTDTKLYDTAKTEVDKVKNAKAKKALTDQLSKVKADIDKKAAEEAKGQAETKQESGTPQQQAKTTEAQETAQAPTQGNQGQPTPDYTGTGGATDNGGYVPQTPQPQVPQEQTPPTSNGGGGNTGTTPPVQPEQPTEPSKPVGPPAGTVGPFYSEDACWAYAESQGWSGFAVTIIDGAMYISPR
ncbi:hypothetical protein A5819_003529 [Enterococcus sp. 7E2_DIV0204]|uniref:hypothetical protein n=1 Tax=unclassified Enterococcus TaxID=2608891 RepID=UPI000A33CEDA|nr:MULTISPECIES: hypothetical protein [unclassified Enterococcus]OTN83979.1 hypothetical protein A5819_003529 [Enterococcus sp. 7E2_DIV0204]OTP47238.1 hypothetical protein A5884_003613 [Enterococcus sp. 7D2_DIV0200]